MRPPGAPIRVLVVDDSAVVRQLVARALGRDDDLSVVATASDGLVALKRLERMEVDAVVLDVEMPELDGLATLERIRARWPKLPVIMCSTLTERGAAVTLDALTRGATDCVSKPSHAASSAAAIEELRAQLVGKLRAAVSVPEVASPSPPVRTPATPSASPSVPPAVIAIGTSTGGPNALRDLLVAMPSLPVPLLIVQHMPPLFTRMLAERLGRDRADPVREGVDGAELRAGETWIAPGGRHMEVVRRGPRIVLRLHDDPPESSCRPAVDVLFRSIARTYGSAALGVVLTGMGQDGLAGSRALVEAGGTVVVQDEATSVVWGMPGFVARAGLASSVVPLDGVPLAILRALQLRSPSPPPSTKSHRVHLRQRLPVRP
jgi:two-component system chemotaxis response regulator CheB